MLLILFAKTKNLMQNRLVPSHCLKLNLQRALFQNHRPKRSCKVSLAPLKVNPSREMVSYLQRKVQNFGARLVKNATRSENAGIWFPNSIS